MLLVLDVPTMLLMTAAASLAMAVSLAAARPQRSKGTGLWALGLVLHAATYVLYTLRGMVPDWASIVVSKWEKAVDEDTLHAELTTGYRKTEEALERGGDILEDDPAELQPESRPERESGIKPEVIPVR